MVKCSDVTNIRPPPVLARSNVYRSWALFCETTVKTCIRRVTIKVDARISWVSLALCWNISITFEQNMSANATLTTVCCVHSNVYGPINTCCIRYHTVIDSIHSTSPPVHAYHTLTSVSVELPHVKRVDNSRSIGVVPVT